MKLKKILSSKMYMLSAMLAFSYLGGVLGDVMDANRQRVDYATDADAEWAAYQNAVSAGYALLNGNPDHSKMFVDSAFTNCTENDYYDAVQAINAAVAALDAKAKPTDATLLAALNAEIAEHGAVDSDNYVLFTYDRFKDAYNRATGLANSQVDTGVEGWAAPAIPSFDLVYATEQLDLWGSRLIKRTTVKTHLNNVISNISTNLDADDYTTESWTNLTAKITAANAVIADTTALQTAVNDARISLLKAQRGLVKIEYLTAIGDTVIDNENMLIYGIAPSIMNIDNYVDVATGYDVYYTKTGTYLGTGAKVGVYNISTDDDVAEYTIVLFGDIDGNGQITSADATIVNAYINGGSTAIAEGNIYFMAADVDRDGDVDTDDANAIGLGNVLQVPTN